MASLQPRNDLQTKSNEDAAPSSASDTASFRQVLVRTIVEATSVAKDFTNLIHNPNTTDRGMEDSLTHGLDFKDEERFYIPSCERSIRSWVFITDVLGAERIGKYYIRSFEKNHGIAQDATVDNHGIARDATVDLPWIFRDTCAVVGGLFTSTY